MLTLLPSLFRKEKKQTISQPADLTSPCAVRKFINLFPVFPTSPVSMATWQGMKDRLLALKFLTALMKMLQEVHSLLCCKLQVGLQEARAASTQRLPAL